MNDTQEETDDMEWEEMGREEKLERVRKKKEGWEIYQEYCPRTGREGCVLDWEYTHKGLAGRNRSRRLEEDRDRESLKNDKQPGERSSKQDNRILCTSEGIGNKFADSIKVGGGEAEEAGKNKNFEADPGQEIASKGIKKDDD